MSAPETWRRRVTDVAELVVWVSTLRPATLAAGRLVCVDGRAGAGKSTLGDAVVAAAAALGTARLVHTDDLLAGWSGLAALGQTLAEGLVAPLTAGRPGTYRRYDWLQERFAETLTVDPVDTLVLEGVGSWSPAYADAVTTLVWVDAPRDLRLQRGLERDGEGMRERWLTWLDDEEKHFLHAGTQAHADVLVDGSGASDQTVVLG